MKIRASYRRSLVTEGRRLDGGQHPPTGRSHKVQAGTHLPPQSGGFEGVRLRMLCDGEVDFLSAHRARTRSLTTLRQSLIHSALLSSAAEGSVHGLTNALPDPTANAGIIEEALQAERWKSEHIRDLVGVIIRRTIVLHSMHSDLRLCLPSRSQRSPLCKVPDIVPQRMKVELSARSAHFRG
jgi:hypothetical protein